MKKPHPPIQITQNGLNFLYTSKSHAIDIANHFRILEALRDGKILQFEDVRKRSGLPDRIWNGNYVFLRSQGYINKII